MNAPTTEAAADRRARKANLRRLARNVTKAERQLDNAIAARDGYLIESHGEKRAGLLSYDELAKATGISKGRAIQIVQGKSDYSKRQVADRQGRTA